MIIRKKRKRVNKIKREKTYLSNSTLNIPFKTIPISPKEVEIHYSMKCSAHKR